MSSPARSQIRPQLRPQTTVEILDSAANLLRLSWAQWLTLSSVGTVPLCVLILVYVHWIGTMHAGTDASAFYVGTSWWALAMTVAWTVNTLARAAVTASVLGAVRGEGMEAGDAWRAALKVSAGSAFIGLVAFVAAWVAGSCVLIPGVILMSGWWVARPTLMEEGRPFAASLRRSWKLTAGYRGRALGLWVLFLVLWAMTALNMHLVTKFMLETGAGMLGIDTSSARLFLTPGNVVYLAFLMVLGFAILDPLKTAMDALFYLDIRIRREGADLQERLRALGAGGMAGIAVLVIGLGLLSPIPALAVTPQEYAARLRTLRQEIERAPKPSAIPEGRLREIQGQVIQLPGGQKQSAENGGIARSARTWSTPEEKSAVVRRLEGLERSLGVGNSPIAAPPPPGASGTAPDPPSGSLPVPAANDAKQSLQQLLTEPEFQPLAERTELKELMKNVRLPDTKNWWQGLWKWIQNNLFKPPKMPQPPQVTPPRGPNWDLSWLQPALYVVLALAGVFLLVLLIRWIIERPVREEPGQSTMARAEVLEQASATENALDHTVDEWELFAQQWLGRGDIRQAIRALYLATLVHLHRERRIDYNRALTNWIYVRQFRGEGDQKGVFQSLTRTFDEVWYGERAMGEELYRVFEQGVRTLGTPAPASRPGIRTSGMTPSGRSVGG